MAHPSMAKVSEMAVSMKRVLWALVLLLSACASFPAETPPLLAAVTGTVAPRAAASATAAQPPRTTDTPTPEPAATVTESPNAASAPSDLETLDERTRSLFGEPGAAVIDFFGEIQDRVRTDDKERLAGLILYPLSIHFAGGEEKKLNNEAEFVTQYEEIATPKWKDAILAQAPERLFANWQGLMAGSGGLWFAPVCVDGGDCQAKKLLIISIASDAQ